MLYNNIKTFKYIWLLNETDTNETMNQKFFQKPIRLHENNFLELKKFLTNIKQKERYVLKIDCN